MKQHSMPSLNIQSILIANRGEIASRIIRTCRKLGIRSIAIYSDVDRKAPFVAAADEAVALGGDTPASSYLDQDKVIAAAKRSGAQAIHPGFGFLSENAGFAQRVADEGLVFIGPSPEAIASMGSKATAKAIMEEHGVPTIPGYRGADQSPNRLHAEALAVGFPLLLKAVAGGGGKGMRIVEHEKELLGAIEAAKREAENAFGDGALLIEKYFPKVRHIEFQIFGDQQGNALHLLERECSIQRRYQKVVEESPSPALDDALRKSMGEAAVAAAKAINYTNAGTVEFILDESTSPAGFYFLEVNTRLQVEHPVTEAITGLDLVEWQIAVAEGRALPLSQQEVRGNGYALECRLYAEDAENDFLPATGTVHAWLVPELEDTRVDSGVESGSEISVFYDPMIAKLIAHGPDRASTHRRMVRLLSELRCLGPTTNREFLLDLVQDSAFTQGAYDTHFLQHWNAPKPSPEQRQENLHHALAAATLLSWQSRAGQRKILPGLATGWRNSYYQPQVAEFRVDGEDVDVHYRELEGGFWISVEGREMKIRMVEAPKEGKMALEIDGYRKRFAFVEAEGKIFLQANGRALEIAKRDRFPQQESEEGGGGYVSPMPSQVLKVLVEQGQQVKAGEGLVVLVSMKMENTIAADGDGTVGEVYVKEGENIEAGVTLLEFFEAEGGDE